MLHDKLAVCILTTG